MHLMNETNFTDLDAAKSRFPLVSIIVINFNGRRYLGDIFDNCIDSILSNDYDNFEVFIVDNCSSDDSIEYIKKKYGYDERINVIALDNNYGTTGAKNAGIKASNGKYVFLLNNDIFLKKETLRNMIQVLEKNPFIGIIGCKLVYPTGKIQSIGEFFSVQTSLLYAIYPTLFRKKKRHDILKSRKGDLFFVDYVVGAALMIRKKLVTKINFYDESFFMYTEEVDLAYRAKRTGYKVACLNNYEIIHYEDATAKHFSKWRRDLISRNLLLFIKKNFYGIKLGYALFIYFIRMLNKFSYSLLTRNKYQWEFGISQIKAFKYIKKPPERPK